MNPAVGERLSYVRRLLRSAAEYASLPDPGCSTCLLLLHDAVGLFLGIVCEHLRVVLPGSRSVTIPEYFDLVRAARAGRDLAHRQGMASLDSAHAWLFHYGAHPARTQLPQHVVRVEDFLLENTREIFGMEFHDASLLPLVGWPGVRRHLDAARERIREDRYRESVEASALGFAALLDEYRRRRGARGRGPRRMEVPASPDPDLSNLALSLSRSLESLEERMLVLSLGLDAAAHRRFEAMTPAVVPAVDGGEGLDNLDVDWRGAPLRVTPAHAEFCLDFVADCAVRVQEAATREGLREPTTG